MCLYEGGGSLRMWLFGVFCMCSVYWVDGAALGVVYVCMLVVHLWLRHTC